MPTETPLFILGTPAQLPANAVPISDPAEAANGYYLHWTGTQYRLCDCRGRHQPLTLDFTDKRYSQRNGKEYLPKAFRMPAGTPIADATAGWAKDAWLLASRGLHLSLYERNPYLHTLLEAALNKARQSEITAAIACNIRLIYGDAADLLPLESREYAAVYLDPMYPDKGKNAKAKKHMQALQQLLGKQAQDNDNHKLLRRALSAARQKVVVKRPQGAPFLADIAPDYSIRAPNTRYDVYTNLTKQT